MTSRTHAWTLALGLLALVAGCGDGNGNGNGNDNGGFDPLPGTYTGTTTDGGSITLVVGSIRAITFDCDGVVIAETFDPPKPIDGDGVFDFSFEEGSRQFVVEGFFTSDSELTGDIDDEDDDCTVGFDATRGPPPSGTTRTPTPTPTTSAGGTTSTPTATPTSSTSGATETPTPTSTSSASASPSPCPSIGTLEGQGAQADLDTGFTGIAMDQKVIEKGAISGNLACPGTVRGSCGTCTVTGPIKSTTVVNNQRCSGDSSIVCSTGGSECASAGQCVFFFGAPLPLSSGGVPVCVTNRVNGQITGTGNPDTGSGAQQVSLTSSVFTGFEISQPCPICTGGGFNQAGVCQGDQGYARNGDPCTVHGVSQLFGNTSFDCPPNAGANVGNLAIALNPTTGTSTLNATASCVGPPPQLAGTPCFCSGQLRPNDCQDGVCTADPTGEGTCESGPADQHCEIETFRGCITPADCPAPGDSCVSALRKCQGSTSPTTLQINGPISRTGQADPNNPVAVSTFCVAATSSSAVNQAAGLPGPGALRLPTRVCYGTTCSF